MKKHSEELKASIIKEHKSKTSVLVLSQKYGVSRNTIYRWIRESEPKKTDCSAKDKEIKCLTRRITRLEEIIQIIDEADCLPSAPLQERLYALERIYGNHSVHILCEALKVDRGTFYNHILRNKKSNTWYAQQREILRIAIQKIYDESRQTFGAGKITAVLKEEGYKAGEETVRRLMIDMGLMSVRQRAKAMYEKERREFCKNRVNQNFTTTSPNQIWVSDVTCFRFHEKNYFICVILDLFSRMVIGYKISHKNSTQLIKAAFKMAYEQRKPSEGLIFHTDRGSNYKSYTFATYLKTFGVVQSFSRAHIPYDNSVVESFFANLKREELYRRKYKSESDLKNSIDEYISFYNNSRPHATNQYKTPAFKEADFYSKEG